MSAHSAFRDGPASFFGDGGDDAPKPEDRSASPSVWLSWTTLAAAVAATWFL